MSYVVIKNIGADETGAGTAEVNQTKAFTDVAGVTVVLSDGKTYHWAPGESKTLADPFAGEALAASNNLKEVSRS